MDGVGRHVPGCRRARAATSIEARSPSAPGGRQVKLARPHRAHQGVGARGGTADDASYSDTAETYSIARYAKKFQVDEIDIINDRLGALGETPKRLGEAAGYLRPDLVYAHLLKNPTLTQTGRAMFHATEGNLLTSAAFASATLKAAIKAQGLFTENGRNLNLMTTHLIVPPALRWIAKELLTSGMNIIARGGTTDLTVERGDVNTLKDENLTLVTDARLENGVVDPDSGTTYAGSASTWYTASIFAQTIEVGYLRGSGRAPQVRPFTLDRGQYGVGWDVQHAIGCKALDWRGFTKNTQ
jgi:hypothetical protein